MTADPGHGGRRGVLLAAAATAVLAVMGATLILLGLNPPGSETSTAPAPSRSPIAPASAAEAVVTGDEPEQRPKGKQPRPSTLNGTKAAKSETFLIGSPPVALHIPSIGVRSNKIVDLGLQDDGTIDVPKDPSAPGWFTPGPSPGQLGPAVIAGHVDSDTGPAVFYRLGALRAGDEVKVRRADGSLATFSVDRVMTFAKDEFPTRAVYGATSRAELRLITCSGSYSDDTGYDSNTVAFAHLV
jgi:sortase (surface protein transpeptidase)